jgi:two-component system NarL family response regulator
MDREPKKIIIVDDSEIYRSGLRDFINRHEGLRVVAEAECGLKAIEAVKQVPADLLLLDLSLPRYSGFDVLKEIRKISGIKVLALSIFESPEMINRVFELGAQGYCVKDVRAKQLLNAIWHALEGKPFVCTHAQGELNFDEIAKPRGGDSE